VTGSPASTTTSAAGPGGPSTTDPVLDPSGKVDADVVVESFDTLKFDQGRYRGKGDLTLGLFNQGSQHHTLLIEGRTGFKLEVLKHGDAAVGDVVLRRGTYLLYCELPGHRAAGMQAELVIS
jgi:uncharacterized cupredoxin-like copper-binding protein